MARFVITDPTNRTQIFEISGSTVSIGRADSNDLALHHPSVSRSHARVTVLPGETGLIIDLGSMNGTFVNGQPVQEHRLADQDRISIGIFELKFDAATALPFYVEAGRDAGRDITGLISRDSLSTGLQPEMEAAAAPEAALRERLTTLEQENKLLKLLLAVGKTLSSVLTPEEVIQQVMELVFQMENVEDVAS